MSEQLPDEINISWCIEDVKSIAEDLTDDECRKVLWLAKRNHDATIGINWDVLTSWADMVRDDRQTTIVWKGGDTYKRQTDKSTK